MEFVQTSFRTHVTSYRVSSFEDAVIFVHDVERCVAKLDRMSQTLIARVILQGCRTRRRRGC
jgi:hypothetical protein